MTTVHTGAELFKGGNYSRAETIRGNTVGQMSGPQQRKCSPRKDFGTPQTPCYIFEIEGLDAHTPGCLDIILVQK